MPTPLAATEESVLDRLVRAADAALLDVDIEAVTVQAVALAAGVSRATAFRQLGTREDMVVAVAMLRAARYAHTCAVEIADCASVFDKIEVAFLYLTRELPADPVMRALFMVQTAADIGDEASELATATLGPVIEEGRSGGVIRADIPTERVVSWLVEQLYLAIQQPDRAEQAVRERVRLFVIPALAPPRPAPIDWGEQVDAASAAIRQAAEAINIMRHRIA